MATKRGNKGRAAAYGAVGAIGPGFGTYMGYKSGRKLTHSKAGGVAGAVAGTVPGPVGLMAGIHHGYTTNPRNHKTGTRSARPRPVKTKGRVRRKV